MAGNLKARSPGLERPDSIIRKTIHHMGSSYEKKYYMHWVLWHWQEIVGEFVARNTSPQGIRNKTLYIYSDNSALRNELQMMMPQVVQSVNNYAGQKMLLPSAGKNPIAKALRKSAWRPLKWKKIWGGNGAKCRYPLQKCRRQKV